MPPGDEVQCLDLAKDTAVSAASAEVPAAVAPDAPASPAAVTPEFGSELTESTRTSMSQGVPAAPPVGTGPLYKCAICGDFVYESQLDYHVLICPEPEPPPPAAADGQGVPAEVDRDPADASAVSAGVDLAPADQAAGASTSHSPPGAAMEDSLADVAADQRLQEKSNNGDSGRHGVQDAVSPRGSPASAVPPDPSWVARSYAHTERVQRRRSKLAEELRQKEVKECTFQPKLLNRDVVRTQPPHWDPQFEARSQKLKQVEAQIYAEATHHPKISPFAAAWSSRQQDVQGAEPKSVFDRLYEAARECTARRTYAALQNGDHELKENSLSLAPGSIRLSLPRNVPTSELLYSDALDRRERLRLMSHQLHMKEHNVAREKLQVLGRSRRYYWQMLERQIKAAFDASVDPGSAQLHESRLEEFLVHFGCARQRRGSAEAGTGDGGPVDDRTAQTCADLWRHLDPHGAGYTDLFTLTVFFHILMGAVDEIARTAREACEAAEPESGNASAGDAGTVAARTAQAVANLSAITEEENTEQRADPGRAFLDAHAAGGATVTDEVPDMDSRIVEFLSRFDPQRLRTEFQTLYMQRMYYQHQHHEKMAAESGEAGVLAPELCEQSRILAAKAAEKAKDAAGEALHNHVDLMLWKHSQAEAKKKDKRAQKKDEEVVGCTFQPQTSAPPKEMQAEITTPRGATRGQVLYARAVLGRELHEARSRDGVRERSRAEVNHCTFRPNTTRSQRTFQRLQKASPSSTGTGAAPRPKGFEETSQRLRAAADAQRVQRQNQEDRLGRLGRATWALDVNAKKRTASAGGKMQAGQIPGVGAAGFAEQTSGAMVSDESAFRATPRGSAGRCDLDEVGVPANPRCASPRAATAWGAAPGGAPSRLQAVKPQSPLRHQRARGQQATHRQSSQSSSPPPQRTPRSVRPSHVQSARLGQQKQAALGRHAAPECDKVRQDFAAQEAAMAETSRAPVAESLQGVREGAGAGPTSVSAGGKEEMVPFLFVDVNIAPGQPMQRLALYKGQPVVEAASEFATMHQLAPQMTQRLHTMLEELMHRQESQA